MTEIAFGAGMVLSIVIMVAFLRWLAGPVPILPPVRGPRYIFRLVQRQNRAAYVQIMHRSLAVQLRDMNRAMDRFGRAIGRELLPVVQRLADALREAFR